MSPIESKSGWTKYGSLLDVVRREDRQIAHIKDAWKYIKMEFKDSYQSDIIQMAIYYTCTLNTMKENHPVIFQVHKL